MLKKSLFLILSIFFSNYGYIVASSIISSSYPTRKSYDDTTKDTVCRTYSNILAMTSYYDTVRTDAATIYQEISYTFGYLDYIRGNTCHMNYEKSIRENLGKEIQKLNEIERQLNQAVWEAYEIDRQLKQAVWKAKVHSIPLHSTRTDACGQPRTVKK